GVSSTIFAFSVEAGGGSVVPARIESDSSGIVQTKWRTGTSSGMNALRVRAFEVFDTTFQLTVRTTGGQPTELRLVSGDNQRVRSGAAVSRAPVIRLVDRFGNPVEAVRVRFLSGAGDTVEPPELVTDERGQVAPRLWTLGEAGAHELKVVADGVTDTLRVRARVTPR
ncbi:MAG: hypothetical protein ABIZ91_14030, partial [Gemmatimonadaceae bacterium]